MISIETYNQIAIFLPLIYTTGMILTIVVYLVSSYKTGKLKNEREFLSTLVEENKYLKQKTNYLASEVKELRAEHQRQLNFQAAEIGKIVDKVHTQETVTYAVSKQIKEVPGEAFPSREISEVMVETGNYKPLTPPTNNGHSIGRDSGKRGGSVGFRFG